MPRPEGGGPSDRTIRIGRFVFVWAALIFLRLIQLQIFDHEDLLKAARSQQEHVVSIPAERGDILDRTGQSLAVTVRTRTAAVNPQLVADPDFFAGNVAPILGLNAGTVAAQIRDLQERKQIQESAATPTGKPDPKAPSLRQLMLKRHISDEENAALTALRRGTFENIEILRDQQRRYPNGALASHVVGALNEEGFGVVGVEARLNSELKGHAGKRRVLSDSHLSSYYNWIVTPAQQGVNVTLTLHRVIQHAAETELAAAVATSGSWAGSVVVLDPQEGDVLAMANVPSFPREQTVKSDQQLKQRTNLAVQAPCEPGSVMKMITVTMGLASGKFKPETPIYCENGVYPRPGRKPIHDVHRYGELDVAGVLIKSSNIGVVKISNAMGPRRMAEFLEKFGMGQRTNVGLPGESRGMLRNPKNWDPASHEYLAFGHEISATAIQLARATAVIANGGLLIQPRVVLKKERPSPSGGEAEPMAVEHEGPKRVIDPETAFAMRRIMQRVVDEGTGKGARIPGYSAGGKTGSAEIYDVKLKRWVSRHNSSFIGFAPVANPRVVVVVTLNGSVKLGGTSAAPVFARVMETALRVLQVPKDRAEVEVPPAPATPAAEEPVLLAQARAMKDEPAASEVHAEEPTNELVGPRVPDFRGKPSAAALRQALALGMPLRVAGKGLVRSQTPAPGRILPVGAAVQVDCR